MVLLEPLIELAVENAYKTEFAYELISQLSWISSKPGVVHSIKFILLVSFLAGGSLISKLADLPIRHSTSQGQPL